MGESVWVLEQRSGLGYVAYAMHPSPRLAEAPKHPSSLYRFILVSGIISFIVQKLVDAILQPILFVFSKSYRHRKYTEWEQNSLRRMYDVVSILFVTSMIAIGVFWLCTTGQESKRDIEIKPQDSVLEIMGDASNGLQRVTVRIDSKDVERVITSKVVRAAFSNVVGWIQNKKSIMNTNNLNQVDPLSLQNDVDSE